jgi:predicted nucleic acid-binding protein
VSKRAIVCDTTVLLYLGRIGQIDLLSVFFSPICVPEPVMLELDMGRLFRPDTIDPRGLAWATPVRYLRP